MDAGRNRYEAVHRLQALEQKLPEQVCCQEDDDDLVGAQQTQPAAKSPVTSLPALKERPCVEEFT